MVESEVPIAENPITLRLILKKNKVSKNQHSAIEDAVLSLKRVWLDDAKVTAIDDLELFGKLTHLYLQNNLITTIENLESVANTLQHLNLRGNEIQDLGDGLICLDRLVSLDISSNKLNTLSYRNLPPDLSFLNYLDNPVTDSVDDDQLIQYMLNLKMLNNEMVDGEEESDEEGEEEEKENAEVAEMMPLGELCKRLKDDSKSRQNKRQTEHNNKIATLALIKSSKDSEVQGAILSELRSETVQIDETVHQSIRYPTPSHITSPGCQVSSHMSPPGTPITKKQLPPLERTLSSQSITRNPSLTQLEPLKPSPLQHKPPPARSNPRTKLASVRTNPPTALPPQHTNKLPTQQGSNMSLRQPLDVALLNTDQLEEYLADVKGKFEGLRAGCKEL